jgi:DNA-binding response OmpR family regulator
VKTVLIVDFNLGFVFWLGQLLQSAGFAAFPARSVSDAGVVLVEFALAVDILILNLSLPGAADLIARLRDHQEHLKVIAITKGGLAIEPRVHADASCAEPRLIDEAARSEWITAVQRILAEGFA